MARRRKTSGLDALAQLPWPVGVVAGVLAFATLRLGSAAYLAEVSRGLAAGFVSQVATLVTLLAWLSLGLCWAAALASYLESRRRRRLLDTCTSLEHLAAGGWRQFEQRVGEAFRRQGYAVEETGLGGADGGIDLILRGQGQKVLVQCKQWRRRQVGVSVVREMAGLLAHHGADAVKIVCIGTFTREAEAFAAGKPIELIGGETLLGMIRAVQPGAGERLEPTLPSAHGAPEGPGGCPRCAHPLVQRTNRRTGETFLGCSRFPHCRGTATA